MKDLLEDFYPRLWRYCLALTRDLPAAEDLCQAACLKALESAHQFQAGTHADRWFFSIAKNHWYNTLRAESVRRGGGLVPSDELALPASGTDAEANFFHAEVLKAVMDLPEAQRVTVFLVYVEGFSYKEAAEHLHIPIGTVMSRLAAARSKLSAPKATSGAAKQRTL
ncbi:MAG TPA: RNA polymerase sigma factor [Kiloniellaceae bacterium]|nr:RNA polymerase sigma factor [Kiloniellaceae bacterium]